MRIKTQEFGCFCLRILLDCTFFIYPKINEVNLRETKYLLNLEITKQLLANKSMMRVRNNDDFLTDAMREEDPLFQFVVK